MLQFEDISTLNIAQKLGHKCGVHQVVVLEAIIKVGHHNKYLQLFGEMLALASRYGCHLRSGKPDHKRVIIITLESHVADL